MTLPPPPPPISNHHDTHLQRMLEAPMPWIGLYIAMASVVCSVAIGADLVGGFRKGKLWFPCKYFSLNAASLALLAVAMKLPVDLTTNMQAPTERLAKLSSLALMSASMSNFMPSLGSMGDREILVDIAALAIFVVTVIVDLCIYIAAATRSFPHHGPEEEILAMSVMLLLLLVTVSSALMVPATKRYLDAKYQEMHDHINPCQVVTAAGLRAVVRKHWLMAETSSSQFVIARSAPSAASGLLCLINAAVLAVAVIRSGLLMSRTSAHSSYSFSTRWILIAQCSGVMVGTVAPVARWCTAVRFGISDVSRSFRDELRVEAYWTQKLTEWGRCPVAPAITHHQSKRLLHTAKGLAVDLVVRAQIVTVVSTKLVLFISMSMLKKRQRVDSCAIPFRHYLRLQGEPEIPEDTLEGISKQMDEVIKSGASRKPRALLHFLKRSCRSIGVAEFDSSRVRSLHFREPPSCWSLPLVTLVSIARALPNVAKNSVDELVSAVRHGLYYVDIVERCVYEDSKVMNITKAAHDIWVGVELYGRWQGMDLCQLSLKNTGVSGSGSGSLLRELADEGERVLTLFKRDYVKKNCVMRNPLNWPAKVLAANSMYRIATTILLSLTEGGGGEITELFDVVSAMIADILAACLAKNIGLVIMDKCHKKAIEERGKSVHEAALLLGQTEEILEFLWRLEKETTGSGEVTPPSTCTQSTTSDHIAIEVVSD